MSWISFAHPRGPLGRLAGHIMAVENRAVNEWAVRLAAAGPADRVLEIGFGPGVALHSLSRSTSALLAGADPSVVMWRQARQRNRRAFARERLDLRVASVEALPWPDRSFSTVLSVRSVHEWRDLKVGLEEIGRVLRPSGLLVLVLGRAAARQDRSEETWRRFKSDLRDCGFHPLGAHRMPGSPEQGIAIRAVAGTRMGMSLGGTPARALRGGEPKHTTQGDSQ